ncbi:MAG TPA: GNAT family N-acetyltransferase [Gaiellaceae bacterium]|nr:GNAT family N-acetyltransferase [Gaiellaceae bacterium]
MIHTERLVLRQWRDDDKEPFAALNADPIVMEHFPSTMSREASDAYVDRVSRLIAERGWGTWAVEVAATAEFIGFVGLNEPRFEAHFTPAVEIGWRLARGAWGHGYATEAARAALAYAFDELKLAEVVSFTTVENWRSRRVMERIGMTYDPTDDFDHPNVTDARIRPHVLYRLARG